MKTPLLPKWRCTDKMCLYFYQSCGTSHNFILVDNFYVGILSSCPYRRSVFVDTSVQMEVWLKQWFSVCLWITSSGLKHFCNQKVEGFLFFFLNENYFHLLAPVPYSLWDLSSLNCVGLDLDPQQWKCSGNYWATREFPKRLDFK